MKRKKIFWLAALAILLTVFVYWLSGDRNTDVYPIRKVIQYSFNIQNTASEVLSDVSFSVYAPVEKTATQKLIKFDASHPYEISKDAFMNQVLTFTFDRIAPYETRIIKIRAELALADASNVFLQIKPGQFLGAEKYIEIQAPELIARAESLKRDNQYDTARAIYDWVSNYLEYKEYIEEDRGALYALDQKQGDCTEYMYLFSALARINGIATRSIGGYVYSGNATLSARDYHNWVEVFMDDKWHIVDPQKRVFMTEQSNYIAMRVISEESTGLLGNSHRFSYSNSNIKVVMN